MSDIVGRRPAAGPAGREGDSAMMNKISGEVLALSPLSSKYYWRQFASQYLTKLIRCAAGGKRGQSRWQPVRASVRPLDILPTKEARKCLFQRHHRAFGAVGRGRDGSVHIANKN